ncbi:hypothetical protein OsI_18802 [Oryza sativa Indica Group]|uniref:cellulase n=1 Tax=Oryza sativa subsp. indica TaxID=39946 RepID=B8AYY3_ORYSI|nr:hypothetical protein OsI_18802 [Oryza sativa Indica Group]
MAKISGAHGAATILLGLLALASIANLCFWPGTDHDYGMALRKSILYFEAQRSGVLPPNQRVSWRASSGLFDGKANGVDLVGGYYDAGDNVKFGLPMAFTVTMMSWGILEYGKQMAAAGELRNAMDAVKWGTDYFIKAHPEPDVLYGEVGDGDSDLSCWERPEDMTTSRQAFRVDPQHPGSDLAADTAAAMAAASIVFRGTYPDYANLLLVHSKQDELLWAAAWLFDATEDRFYLEYLAGNGEALDGTGWSINQFGWDVKYPGVQVLAAKFLLQGRAGDHAAALQRYRQNAEFFVCSCVAKGAANVARTPGGMMYHRRWNNLQFVTSASFLLTVYADFATMSGHGAVRCPAGAAQPFEILNFVKSQVNYILGDNPRGTSYMVAGAPPWRVHRVHQEDPSLVSCKEGYSRWYVRKAGNPNLVDAPSSAGPTSTTASPTSGATTSRRRRPHTTTRRWSASRPPRRLQRWPSDGRGRPVAHSLLDEAETIKYDNYYFYATHLKFLINNGVHGDHDVVEHPGVRQADGDTEHSCWQQPEDMMTSRQAFRVDPQHPDLATETAPTFHVNPQHPDRATAHTGASPISSSYTPRHARKDNILTGKSRMWEGSWREQEETF